jgi:YesN/AraC family two-component response regulator
MTYFSKLVLSYTLITMLVILILGGYLLHRSDKMIRKEIEKDNEYRLKQIQSYTENALLRKYESAFLSKMLSTINPKSTDEVQFFQDNRAEEHLYRVSKLVADLNLSVLANEGMENLTLYFTKHDFLVDRNGYYAKPEHTEDAAFMKTLAERSPYQWFTRKARGFNNREVETLTCVYPIPYMASGDEIKGYLVIDIRMAYLKDSLEKLLVSPDDRLFLLDQNQNLFLETSSREKRLTAGLPPVRPGEMSTVLHSQVGLNSWSYVLYRPVNSILLSSSGLRKDIFFSAMLSLVLGGSASWLLSRRFNRPMRKLLKLVQPLTQEPKQKGNEYDYISRTISGQSEAIQHLSSKLQCNQIAVLIAGHVQREELPERYLSTSFVVVQLHLDDASSSSWQSQLTHTKLSKQYEVQHFFPVNNEAVLLYLVPLYEAESPSRIAHELALLQEQSGVVFSAGIGSRADTLEEIYLSYEHACYAHRYCYIYGLTSILLFVAVKDRKAIMTYDYFEQWKQILRTLDAASAKRFLDDIQNNFLREEMSIEAVELVVLQLGAALSELIIQAGLQYALPVSSSHSMLQIRDETLDQSLDRLRQITVTVFMELEQNADHTHKRMIEGLIEYIHQHLHEDLSLNQLAELVHLSPAYVSTLFKEVTQETFSEYTTRQRMNRASELLRTTNESIKHIAEKSGYPSAKYFCTKFKLLTGLSPTQYRQQHLDLKT